MIQEIFEKPQFFIDGATASDVRQGKDGDCWFMSALSTLSNKPGLIQKVCVARNEKVGVYGFVFHRGKWQIQKKYCGYLSHVRLTILVQLDGEWISEVIDDKLYLIKEDFDDSTVGRNQWLELQNRNAPEEEYRAVMQTGSRALYFAQCSDQNETWLPLLEKAYAKSHGDYAAIDGGFVGEGIEDLTGGVTTEVFATDILDKDRFWNDELMKVNKEFLFGCGQMGGVYGQRRGIQERHAYSIMEAVEIDGVRLLKLRNPWGNTEWRGPWSDGSSEWTPEWMSKLNHRFGDDGIFWISYQDLLRNYQHFDRTRLFGDEWSVTQRWTSLNVPWSVNYLDTKFKIRLHKRGPVVIVLSQLDDRYFLGLTGQYTFRLQFRIHAEGEVGYIVRSNVSYYMKRSISTELELDAGTYIILPKITATRDPMYPTPEEVVRQTCRDRREKLLQIGLSYDLAHAKGGFRTLAKEKKEKDRYLRYEKQKEQLRKEHEARAKTHKKQKLRKKRLEMKKIEKAARRAAFEQEQEERMNGLGIEVNGEDGPSERRSRADGIPLSNPFASGPSGPGNTDSRPTTPNGRPSSPNPAQGFSRRETLPIHPMPRRNTLSPVPNIYVHRPSVGSTRPTLTDVSDDDLSWDSELMGPESEPDSDSDDSGARDRAFHGGGPDGYGMNGYGAYGGFGGPERSEVDSDDDFEIDPWNAVVCIGLRVYSMDKEVDIEVLRPDEGVTAHTKRIERTLDLDDSAMDATKRHMSAASEFGQEDRGEEERLGAVLLEDHEEPSITYEGDDGDEVDEFDTSVEIVDGAPAGIEESRQG